MGALRRKFLNIVQKHGPSAKCISAIRLCRKGGYIEEKGWLRSERERWSVDASGQPIPWINYSALALIENRIKPQMTVFEWGCGASTLWFSDRVREVHSCEHDSQYFERIKKLAKANAHLACVGHTNNSAYEDYPKSLGLRFDLILIDGKKRVKCADTAANCLSDDGVIVWDNTERIEYWEKINELKKVGFRNLTIEGLTPAFPCLGKTTILYRAKNCFGL